MQGEICIMNRCCRTPSSTTMAAFFRRASIQSGQICHLRERVTISLSTRTLKTPRNCGIGRIKLKSLPPTALGFYSGCARLDEGYDTARDLRDQPDLSAGMTSVEPVIVAADELEYDFEETLCGSLKYCCTKSVASMTHVLHEMKSSSFSLPGFSEVDRDQFTLNDFGEKMNGEFQSRRYLELNSKQFLSRFEPRSICLNHIRHYAASNRRTTTRVKRQKSYYEVLKITPNATHAQVKEAYIKMSKIYHPDKNAGSKDAQEQFSSINEAYSVLGNSTLRKRYDRGTLSQRDVHGEVRQAAEEKEDDPRMREAMYTGTGIPFNMEAQRQAKNLDDFFSQHYKGALQKEQRDRVQRQQRIDEYLELQRKAKLSPLALLAFIAMSLVLAYWSVRPELIKSEAQPGNKRTKEK